MTFYLTLIIAYLIGGVPFGLIAGHLFGQGDIRRVGSGNIGATNVFRAVGTFPAVLVLLADIGKGVFAVWLCQTLYQPVWPVGLVAASLIAGIMAILGHVFSPYLGFRGGKGVNTALGVFIYLLPLESVIALAVFVVAVTIFRYISLGSMLAAVVFALVIWGEKFIFQSAVDSLFLIVSALLVIFILYTHRENIRRLSNGTESRFTLRKGA